MKSYMQFLGAFAVLLMVSSSAKGQNPDGLDLGGTSRFLQDTPTGEGDATGGGQDSAGGSEINQVWGDFDASSAILSLSISGNLQGNSSKMFLFIDAVAGGENVLLSDNFDGGGNEIKNLAGLTFDDGFTADHGLRFNVEPTAFGVHQFDLIDNTASAVVEGIELPAIRQGNPQNVFVGWDNSNTLGVTESTAAGAATATTGWELEIDMFGFIGGAPGQDIKVAGFVTNGDATSLSNQVIGGLNGANSLGTSSAVNFNTIADNQYVTITAIPEPTSAFALCALGVAAVVRRRRRR